MAKKKGPSVVEPPLPGASNLPEFEGVQPVGVVTKLNGSSQRIVRAIHLDETGVALVEFKGDDIGHKRTKKEGVKRHQTLAALDVYELAEGKCPGCGCDLLVELRAEQRKNDPQLSIDDVDQAAELGRAMRTDESGVVLTDAELAERLEADRAAVAEIEAGRAHGDPPPWDDFDRLGVGPVKNRLEHCDDQALVNAVAAYEAAHKNRAGVIDAAQRRHAQLLAKGDS
jgi:hypothetical protein